MTHSKQDSKDSVKVPTLDDWIKAKEASHKKMVKLSFIKKLKILDRLKEVNSGTDRQEDR